MLATPYSLQENVGACAIERNFVALNTAIKQNHVEFGNYLVQYEFANVESLSENVDVDGRSDSDKVRNLLKLVILRLKTQTCQENAVKLFNNFVLIIANKLNRGDLAQDLVSSYRELVCNIIYHAFYC